MYAAAVLLTLAATALAQAPIPDVTYPHNNKTAVWVIGFQHNVTWDTTNSSSSQGSIALAKAGIADTQHTLAAGFPLSAGRIEVTVPNVTPGADYTVVLTVNGNDSSSAPFVIAQSKDSLPSISASAANSSSTIVTTVTFPSATLTGTVTPGSFSSVTGNASAIASGAQSTGTSPSGSGSGSNSSSTSKPNGAVAVVDALPIKLLSGVAALAISAGALLL